MPLDQLDIDKLDLDNPVEKEMSFLDHLEELRWHILRSLIAIVVVTIAVFLAKDFVFETIIFGPRNANFPTYQAMMKLAQILHLPGLNITPPPFSIETRDLGEVFFVHLQVSFFMGIIVSFPYIFWEFWRFVKPGLHSTEVKAASGIVFVCSSLFISGVLFGYYVIAPFAISFLAGYTVAGTSVTPTLDSYVNYMTMFTIPIGIVFELPIVIYFLSKIGLVTPTLLRGFRRHTIVIVLLVSGIITPSPDVISQLLVSVPLYILYEVSILVSQRVVRNKAKNRQVI